ncbi:MAG: tetratricopeptide repeat protein [Planctomycetota bacterium]|nr:tetratricopeptide repeat protein [Planctomycetota bacterium]MDP7250885.1 tetratricopeptide repeat protein [Planctomycetota bacterium]
MNRMLPIVILIAGIIQSTDRVCGESLHSPKYYEAYYSGLIAMHERRLEDAAEAFTKAISSEGEKERAAAWSQNVVRTLDAAKEGTQIARRLSSISQAPSAVKLYFISKYLNQAHTLGPAKAREVMDHLPSDMKQHPWNLPGKVAAMVHLYHADALSDMSASMKPDEARSLISEAASLYGQVARQGPVNLREAATKNAAILQYKMRDYAAALVHYLDLISTHPYTPDRQLFHLNTGKCYLMQKNYAAAEEAFVTAARDFPAGKGAVKADTYIRYTRKKGGL